MDYLHKMQRVYESEIGRMQDMIDHSTNSREVAVSTKRKEKLQKQLKECRDYDEMIAHLALSRIELDLDDGVKVNSARYRPQRTASSMRSWQIPKASWQKKNKQVLLFSGVSERIGWATII